MSSPAAKNSNTLTCKQCNKTVYEMEKMVADNVVYHKTCFRCTHCKRILSLGNYTANGVSLYCKPHFMQLFKEKGNYDEGFGKEKKKMSSAKADGIDSLKVGDEMQSLEGDEPSN